MIDLGVTAPADQVDGLFADAFIECAECRIRTSGFARRPGKVREKTGKGGKSD